MMVPAKAMDIGSKLIHMLTQQQLLYRQLRELANEQRALVDSDEPETLLRLLAGRQRLIDKLVAIDKELSPIRADWQEIVNSLPETQRMQAESLLADVKDILSEILARDKRDTSVLSNKHRDVAQQIGTTNKGKQVNQAYIKNKYSQNDTVKSRVFDTHCQ